jgi:opacity protein-like surface antigen
MMKSLLVAAASAAMLATAPLAVSHAADIEGPVKELVDGQIRGWISDPAVVEAVKAQNAKNSGLSQADIDALDQQWRAETSAGAKPMIDETLGNALSAFLKKVKNDSKGLYTEIFVMDNKGLNVGQSDVTSDYWQGDEDKWSQTYSVGPDALLIGEVEQDESTQRFQTQVSLSVVDPASGEVIGAVTIGVDVESLTQ